MAAEALTCGDPDEEEPDPLPIVQRIVPALELRPAATRAPRSVFDLARTKLPASELMRGLQAAANDPNASLAYGPRYGRTVKDGDVTRHVVLRREQTEEWAAWEQHRRAKQRPPRHTNYRRARSKKLLKLIGFP